jgi:hypothetical protein
VENSGQAQRKKKGAKKKGSEQEFVKTCLERVF